MMNLTKLPPKISKKDSPSQAELYNFIVKTSQETWSFPTTAEMVEYMDLTKSRVMQLLGNLEEKSYIERLDLHSWRLLQKIN